MSLFWTEALILAGLIAYILYANRRVMHYRTAMLCEGPLEVTWQAHLFRPDRPELWFKEMTGVTWEDEARQIYRVTYNHGKIEVLIREVEHVPPSLLVLEGAYLRSRDQLPLDTFRAESRFEAVPGGTLVTTDMQFVRGALLAGFWMRLFYPFVGFMTRGRIENNVKKVLAASGLTDQSGAVSLAGGHHRLVERIGGWPAILTVVAILWFIIDLGLWPGLVLITTIVVHESGHLWSMRRHGVPGKATLVPFFGGLAYGAQPMPSDSSDAEMILMGPAFGFALGLAVFAFAQSSEASEFWWAAAGMILVINGLNLLPVPPLDGGQVMPLLLRRFGQKVVTAVSLLLVTGGAVLAWWMSSILMLVLIVALGTMIALNPPRGVVRPAMSIGAAFVVLVAYLALMVAHILLVVMITRTLELTDWFEQLMNGPF